MVLTFSSDSYSHNWIFHQFKRHQEFEFVNLLVKKNMLLYMSAQRDCLSALHCLLLVLTCLSSSWQKFVLFILVDPLIVQFVYVCWRIKIENKKMKWNVESCWFEFHLSCLKFTMAINQILQLTYLWFDIVVLRTLFGIHIDKMFPLQYTGLHSDRGWIHMHCLSLIKEENRISWSKLLTNQKDLRYK